MKDFVGDDRQAETRDYILFVLSDRRARRIVRIDDEQRARAIGDRVADSRFDDFPSLVKLEREVVEVDQLERGEMFEQWIRRFRRQHRIARIAEQFEKKRIRLAG